MTDDEKTRYLANIYYIVMVDGDVEPVEERIFEQIAKGIGAGYFEQNKAREMAKKDDFTVTHPARWSDRIRSMEDLLAAAFSDKRLDKLEKKRMTTYAKQLGINQEQMNRITKETKARLNEMHLY